MNSALGRADEMLPSSRLRRARRGGSSPTMQVLGVLCLLLFFFVTMSQKLPLGSVAMLLAWLMIIVGRVPIRIPAALRWYLLFLVTGSIGFLLADVPEKNTQELLDAYKVVLIGIAICSLLTTERLIRLFAIGYLGLYAVFPVRGTLYNFIHGITEFGRVSWNFYFGNPNDLAIACLLPLGLCGFVISVERGWARLCAIGGVSVLLLIIFLTQSRGAILGLAVGALYFLISSRRRLRLVLFASIATALAVVLAPQGVWDRLAGLSNASVQDMSGVDPEGSAESRWAIMGIGIEIAASRPVTGVGIGHYPYFHFQRTAHDSAVPANVSGFRDAHSMYIRSAAEAGLLGSSGVAAFVIVSILAVRQLRRQLGDRGSSQRSSSGVLALEFSMIAYSVAAIFGSVERTTFTILQYLLPWAIAVVLVSAGADTGPAPASPVRESSRRKPRTLGQYQNAALPAVDSDSGAIRGKEIPGVR